MGLSRYLSTRFSGATSALRRGRRRNGSNANRGKRLGVEPLEPRVLLAAAGLVPVGAQPTGELSGKIVYTSGGHGWQYSSALGRWATDRGDNNEVVEDFGNQDQMTFFAEYAFRAGATVVPMRPVGHQLNEVVLDNDSAGVTFSGSWSNNTAGPRWYDEDYGAVADSVKYRFASANVNETSVATYTPNIPEEGFYPVYAWASSSGNRTTQLYKVNHTGGQTQVRIDHRMVGNGWVYLGTYHFDSGSSAANGSVQISNQSTAGGNVIADAIRFGNGMGDVRDGSGGIGTGSISGYPREDENSLMWIWRSIGQDSSGHSPDYWVGTSNVSAPANMAEQMNANTNAFGSSVYIGFHSNASNGSARGAVGLMTNDAGLRTPHQADLALYTGRQINQDMQALNGTFEHNWSTRTTHTYAGINFGEINKNRFTNSSSIVEMDATIIEVAYHDNVEDAQLMRDPDVRDQLARSTYQAVLEYFDAWGGLSSPVSAPTAPRDVRAASNASGQVTLNWSAGPNSPTSVNGNAATGFRIYASSDGYGFDGGTYVSGGGTNAKTLSGYDPNLPYFFKVVAVNAGGESGATEVVAVVPTSGGKNVLIVNGFDRLDRALNPRQPYAFTSDGLTDRVWPRYSNSFDYAVQMATAIHAHAPDVRVNTANNEAVASGAVNLNDYEAVFWIVGEESTGDDTFNPTEQTRVTNYLAAGGKLFLSGGEIGWDLDEKNNGRSFYNNVLRADFVSDDAETYNVVGAGGSIFAGLSFSFDDGTLFYDTDYADRISPLGGATAAMSYSGGLGGTAAIQFTDANSTTQLVMLGFPFETITTAAKRAAVMERVVDYFSLDVPPFVPTGDFNEDGLTDGTDFLAWQRHVATANPTLADGDGNNDNQVDGADLALWRTNFGSQTVAAQGASAVASSASLTAEEGLGESVLTRSSPLLDDMAAIAQRVAAGEALAQFGPGKPLRREVAAVVAEARRPQRRFHQAVDLALSEHRDVQLGSPGRRDDEGARTRGAGDAVELESDWHAGVNRPWDAR
jgi:hypothetical protein